MNPVWRRLESRLARRSGRRYALPRPSLTPQADAFRQGPLPMHKPPNLRRRPHRPGLPDPSGRHVLSHVITSPLSRSRSGQGRLRWGQNDARPEGPSERRHKIERTTLGADRAVGKGETPSQVPTTRRSIGTVSKAALETHRMSFAEATCTPFEEGLRWWSGLHRSCEQASSPKDYCPCTSPPTLNASSEFPAS